MGSADWAVFRWINGLAGDHGWLDSLGKAASNDLALVIVLTLTLGWLLAAASHACRERRVPRELLTVVISAGAALAVGLIANQVIGHVWFRARPYDTHPETHLLVGPSGDPSFPSDHATAGFALALGSATRLPRTGALIFVETVLLSLGRVFVGRHYPGDIAASLAVASSAALGVEWLVLRARWFIDRVVEAVNRLGEQLGVPVRLA